MSDIGKEASGVGWTGGEGGLLPRDEKKEDGVAFADLALLHVNRTLL